MNALERAKKILHEKNYTFVLLKDSDIIISSHKKGLFPLMEIIRKDGNTLNNAVVADKVIGKAAALLAAGFQVKALYADLISQRAIEVLDQYSVPYQYKECVDSIQNRDKSGQCPIEKLTEDINDYQIAYHQILYYYKEVLKINL